MNMVQDESLEDGQKKYLERFFCLIGVHDKWKNPNYQSNSNFNIYKNPETNEIIFVDKSNSFNNKSSLESLLNSFENSQFASFMTSPGNYTRCVLFGSEHKDLISSVCLSLDIGITDSKSVFEEMEKKFEELPKTVVGK